MLFYLPELALSKGFSFAPIKTVPIRLYFIGFPATQTEYIPFPFCSEILKKIISFSLQSFSTAMCFIKSSIVASARFNQDWIFFGLQ